MSAHFSFDPPGRPRRPGILAGIAISLLLHAVLLFGYRLSKPPEQQQPARAMTVWLRPVQPPAPPMLTKVAPPPPQLPPKRGKPQLARAAPAISAPTPAAPAQPVESPAITVPREQDPLYADQQPKQFNMDEALKTARAVAKEKARPGTLTAQLEAHPLYAEDHETQLQKGVAGAKKSDCLKSGAALGILAPLAWAFDKHCKF